MLRKLKLSQHRHGGDSSYIMYTSTRADSWGQLRKTSFKYLTLLHCLSCCEYDGRQVSGDPLI